VLIATGHFYRNRDQGDLPDAVKNILYPHRWIGPL
jgi:hypothetical protein